MTKSKAKQGMPEGCFNCRFSDMKITDNNREMFEVFAKLHPIEAYDLDRKAFYKFMKKKMPALSRKTIDELMVETKVEIKATE